MSGFLRGRGTVSMVLFVIGSLLLAYAMFSGMTRVEPPAFQFTLVIDKLGPAFATKAAGSRKVYGKQFYYEGERISFLGEVEGGHVTVKGTVRSGGEEGKIRNFIAEGTLADNRMITGVFSEKGSKIGKFELQF